MPDPAADETRILFLAPTKKDTASAQALLTAAGLTVRPCDSIADLCRQIPLGGGAVVLPEEAVRGDHGAELAAALRGQPAWSDLPVLILTAAGRTAEARVRALHGLGDVTLLKRPLEAGEFVTAVRAAVRDRRRQYAVRDHLAERGRLAETLGLAIDAAELGTWEWDPATDGMTLSARAAAIYGVDPAGQHRREALRELIHPDDRERARAAAERAVATRSDYDIEYRVARPGGGLRWVAVRGRGVYDAAGRPTRMLGVVQDVTARKEAEEALRESEGRHRLLAGLAAATQPLSDPGEIMAASARLLAEHLGADRCAYAEVEGEAVYAITGDHCLGVPSIVGRWPVGAFGAEHLRMMRAGEPYVVDDADADPRIAPTDLPAYRATAIRAVVCVPLLKGGRLTAAMAVHQAVPRHWSAAEVELVTTVVARCWEALERARADRARRAGAAQLRLVTDTVPALIAFVGADRRYQVANRQYEEWFGRPRAEVEGRHVWEVIGREAYEHLRPHIDRGLAGERVEFETFAPYPAGGRHIRAAFVPQFDGDRVAGYFSLITDATERKRAEERLQRSHDTFLNLIQNNPFGVYLVDADFRLARVSLGSRKVFANVRPLLGRDFAEVLRAIWQEPAATEFVDRFRHTLATGEPHVSVDTTAPRGDVDAVESYDWRIERVPLPDGRHGVVCYFYDMTERRRIEDSLKDADRRKDEFLALLAHELRNPLAPLRNGLQVMRMAADAADVARAREMMDRQLTHMVRLIDDLLDVSRISQNKMELRRAWVRLADVVATAVETVRPTIDAAGHELTVSLPDEPVHLDADLTRLAQVVGNLLTNSAKYTPPGGRIRLTAGVDGGQAVVTVRDTGIGIPAASLPAIFNMFSQVDRSVERSTGGLGIGLALVKGLVEMHGGTVTAASDGQGAGSTFTVRLPLPTSAPPPTVGVEGGTAAAAPRPPLPGGGRQPGRGRVDGHDARPARPRGGRRPRRPTSRGGGRAGAAGRHPDGRGHAAAERAGRHPPHPPGRVGAGAGHHRPHRVGAGERPRPLEGRRVRRHLVKPVELSDLERLLAKLTAGRPNGTAS